LETEPVENNTPRRAVLVIAVVLVLLISVIGAIFLLQKPTVQSTNQLTVESSEVYQDVSGGVAEVSLRANVCGLAFGGAQLSWTGGTTKMTGFGPDPLDVNDTITLRFPGLPLTSLQNAKLSFEVSNDLTYVRAVNGTKMCIFPSAEQSGFTPSVYTLSQSPAILVVSIGTIQYASATTTSTEGKGL
jgi:hypothetical protein